MSNLQEIWLPITNYEGLYEVSNMGRIKSCERFKVLRGECRRYMPEKIKTAQIDKYGYEAMRLCKNGKKSPFLVHRLVAIHFLPNPDNKPTVNHKYGIKTDNRASQLEWATLSEQAIHAFAHGLKTAPCTRSMLGKFGKNHNRSKPVIQLDMDGNFIREYECAKETKRIGNFCPTQVSRCCQGLTPLHKGFKWQFKNPEDAVKQQRKSAFLI